MKDRLDVAVKQSRAAYTEIRVERTWSSAVAFRGRRLETATVSEDQGGFVRVLNHGCGWGIASFTSLDELPAMVARANELSRAVRLDDPIRLAETAPAVADAMLELDGDVRGVALAEKKQLLDRYNGAMLAVSNAIVDTQSSYRDEVSEVWYVNSEGTSLYQLRPDDLVQVARADRWLTFRVVRTVQYAKNRFPTADVYGPTPDPQLRLITCGGSFDAARRSYVDNVVVYAVAE